MKTFKIQGYWDIDDECYLYWSNEDGWVDFDSATVFNADELYYSHFPIETKGIALIEDCEVVSLEEAFDRLKEYYPKEA